jgi:hypothetical protein
MLAARLRRRRAEIEEAILTRAFAISDPAGVAEPMYLDGLRAAISAALDYGIAAIERGAERPPSIPTELLLQARLAAGCGVSLDTVLRRYFAGYALLGDFTIEEARAEESLDDAGLKSLLRAQASLFDRVLAAIGEEHAREEGDRFGTAARHRFEQVRRLLDGELLDDAELGYDLDSSHLGAVATGRDAADLVRQLALKLDRRLLLVRDGEGTVWGWLGGRRDTEPAAVARLVSASPLAGVSVAIGEPGRGPAGWRLTHRQAAVALPVALRRREPFVRYAGVALLASAARDDVLVESLHQLFLAPLDSARDGGKVARETLRAYFAANRNVSSAASALGVRRQTVANRLRAVEERLGLTVDGCAAELEVALAVGELPPRASLPPGP